jgi:glycosyltransferase involved in cell wall biosynthesis
LRIVFVTRHFWPSSDDADGLLADLAVKLAERDARVTVLAARLGHDWPYQVDFEQVRVLRLPFSNRRGWGTLKYMRSLTAWLRPHHEQFDLVCVCGMRHDAYATLAAAASAHFPVVLRVDRAGLSGDCHWQLDATFGYRIKRRCISADALIAPSRTVERELIAAGYPRDRIHYIPSGVEPVPPRTSERRTAARQALAEAHAGLSLGANWPLVLYRGPLHESKGLNDLIEAWPAIVARWPNARLWLVGDGPHADRLSAQVASLGMNSWMTLPGTFDDDEDLLAAADVFVYPALEEGMPTSLLRAMAASVPVVATSIAAHRALLDPDQQGLLAPVQNPAALAECIGRLLDDDELAAHLAENACRRVTEEFPLLATIERHLALFGSLVPLGVDMSRS